MKLHQIFDDIGPSVESFIKKRCGKKIGSGCFRDVYELKEFPRHVAKIEKPESIDGGMFCNATEWRNYINNIHWLDLTKWVAPCKGISADGLILIQQKVQIKNFDRYPASIPNVFTDHKYENYGWIGERFVCCDYAFLVHTSLRMKKVKWWYGDKNRKA